MKIFGFPIPTFWKPVNENQGVGADLKKGLASMKLAENYRVMDEHNAIQLGAEEVRNKAIVEMASQAGVAHTEKRSVNTTVDQNLAERGLRPRDPSRTV